MDEAPLTLPNIGFVSTSASSGTSAWKQARSASVGLGTCIESPLHHFLVRDLRTSIAAIVMFSLARWKRRIGAALNSDPFRAEAAMTFLDGCLTTSILTALALNLLFGWSWAETPITRTVS